MLPRLPLKLRLDLSYAVAIVMCLTIFLSCGIKPASPKAEYSYQWQKGDCPTGKHTFSSKDEYCRALLDESLNAGCAKEEREADYKENCQK